MKGIKFKENKLGITLIALIITIIVLLILAGVSISMIAGDNGILTQAKNAKEKNIESTAEDKVKLEVLGSYDSNGKLKLETVKNNIENNIDGKNVKYVGEEGISSLRATVDGNEFIIDEDGTVRRPVTNPYDKDGWICAWICEKGVWNDTLFSIDDEVGRKTVKDAETIEGNVIAKMYLPNNLEEIENDEDIVLHLVIEGTGKMGALCNVDDGVMHAWIAGDYSSILSMISEVYICDGVENIPDACFAKGTSINKILIGDTVTSIGNFAFAYCSTLENITIPSSVTSIGGDVKNLDGFIWGGNVFFNCTNLKSITIQNGLKSIGSYAFYKCILESVTIPGSVKSIGDNAFGYCENLKNVTIQEGVTSIGKKAFENCEMLTSIMIPSTVTSIGKRAFEYCGLESVTIPGSVESIEDSTFYWCENLKNVIIQNGVKTIENSVLWGCTNLENISIPNSVESIGSEVFASYADSFIITYDGTMEKWGKITLANSIKGRIDAIICTDGTI